MQFTNILTVAVLLAGSAFAAPGAPAKPEKPGKHEPGSTTTTNQSNSCAASPSGNQPRARPPPSAAMPTTPSKFASEMRKSNERMLRNHFIDAGGAKGGEIDRHEKFGLGNGEKR
ncbi:hypothetical protein MMC29_004696, partial [Sticta canariensis]|nr:hypothetical protein [Sticta canariensis]